MTIRLSITKEVSVALSIAKKRYPTLSDPEILKLGLAKIITDDLPHPAAERDMAQIRRGAAYAIGNDYLSDADEDTYTTQSGTSVHFS